MGSEQALRIFGLPSFAVCSRRPPTRFTPATKSIAPPGPFTILPGTIQFAMSPLSATSSARESIVDVPAADHRERVGTREERRAGDRRNRLLAGVDEVGVHLVVRWERPCPSSPFSD